MTMDGIPSTDLLSFLFDSSRVPEDRKILVDAQDGDKYLTKGDLRRLTKRLVAGWRHVGAKAGISVCVHGFNSIYYPLMFYGIVGAGGRFAGSNPAYTTAELVHHLKTSRSSFILTDAEQIQQVMRAAEECGIPESHIFLLNATAGKLSGRFRSWQYLLEHGSQDWISFDSAELSRETAAGLFSTSGTTGMPKMAVRTHRNFVAECLDINNEGPLPYVVRRLLGIPLFHLFAAPMAITSSLYMGYTTYIMRRFQQAQFSTAVKRFDINETAVVPPILLGWISSPEPPSYPSLMSVRCGGAPLDAESQQKALKLLGKDARIVQVWGMTEAGWITTLKYPHTDNTGSVGYPLPSYRVRIVDEQGNEMDDGARGEVQVKGPLVMHSYFDNKDATEAMIDPDGWLSTGDVAYRREGRVYIVDRTKDLIKVRGWQVSPSEVEGVLRMHPDISDAAVVGVMSADRTTEFPRAFVVTDQPLGPADIRNFLLRRLAKYKVGECDIRFVDSIPKSISGKILRKALRAVDGASGAVSNDTIPASVTCKDTTRADAAAPDTMFNATAPSRVMAVVKADSFSSTDSFVSRTPSSSSGSPTQLGGKPLFRDPKRKRFSISSLRAQRRWLGSAFRSRCGFRWQRSIFAL